MSLLQRAPRLDAVAASALARELYGLAASATELPSERDQNFRLDTDAGDRFVLKISNASEDRALVDAQNAAMAHVAMAPFVVCAANGAEVTEVTEGTEGTRHFVRLLTWIPGKPMGSLKHHPPALLEDLGRRLGEMDLALASFDHAAIHREFHWDLGGGLDLVRRRASLLADTPLGDAVVQLSAGVERRLGPHLGSLRRSAIHGDANDYNVIVAEGADRVAGFIDFGDMVHSIAAADLAIAIAYAVLDKRDPLAVARTIAGGYHATLPLTAEELSALWDLVLLRLCMSVAIAAEQQRERPADAYLGISQGPIERTLSRLAAVPPRFAEATFREACGLDPVPAATRVVRWLQARHDVSPLVPGTTTVVDLSVGSPLVSLDPAESGEPAISSRIWRVLEDTGAAVGVGRYGEPRMLYASGLFAGRDARDERRTIHLGLDLFAPEGTVVRAPLAGTVHLAVDNAAPLDYGPVIVLRHETGEGDEFYTLYGHLTRASLEGMTPGRRVEAGAALAAIGGAEVNGGWTPHLHFQIIIDLLDLGRDYPGVCRASERRIWQAFSPDPDALARVPGGTYPAPALDAGGAVAERRRRTGSNLSIGYREPIAVARGWKQYLYDTAGRRYLDAYNNVPHVGHAHPRVVRAVAEQSRVLNTNTRYLHESLARYAERLTATLPDPLRVCFFVNSGSEANELALRLARAHTGRRDVIVLEHAYHGNTTSLIDISPYKFNGPGGEGAAPWVHVAPLPDMYRGAEVTEVTEGAEAAVGRYAARVADTIAALHAGRPGSRLCAFIAETCPSVAGQIVLPAGYLAAVYASVRAAGGLCIADEVQTAYGRMGTHLYAFEDHGVVPDVVVLGKPIGNGYPLGAVVTTVEIAASFDNGMEFFSTFGGSTVSCAAGLAVLDVVESEQLQAHALRVGERLLSGLGPLVDRHRVVGDVRGSGLFLGVELVRDRVTLEPADAEASYVVNRMREEGVLLGTDGPFHNVLKIRPPMPFDLGDADRLVGTLDEVLSEVPQ